MENNIWQDLVNQLRGVPYQFGLITLESQVHRVGFDVGLTDSEVQATEAKFNIRFPPDLRAFLQTALPQGPRFPNWRTGNELLLRDWLDAPRKGIIFDVEYNDFWLDNWGKRPKSIEEALLIADGLIASAPKLIPIYGHRMIPDEPNLPGNPVFSVHQTDIIQYGFDLADYLRNEFNLCGREPWPDQVRPIRFWDLDQFQEIRWARGSCEFDNSKGQQP
ncbi:MAG: SMI1/KNR4 family protein [Candidatus Riflebacteria bacterium]|nr:SMI1/KNR4 family protein [Candidatus Riflebacteria bacterium]